MLICIFSNNNIEYKIEKRKIQQSAFKKLLEYSNNCVNCKIAEGLLDYENIDMDIYQKFLELSMPSIGLSTFPTNSALENLSCIVTVTEEAFALLIFENNLKRWVYLAECAIASETDDDLVPSNVPNVLYQENRKKRKDGRFTAGKWTKLGYDRMNEIVLEVQKQRKEREAFEERLRNSFFQNLDESEVSSISKKRKRQDVDKEEDEEEGSERSKVINLLDIDALEQLN